MPGRAARRRVTANATAGADTGPVDAEMTQGLDHRPRGMSRDEYRRLAAMLDEIGQRMEQRIEHIEQRLEALTSRDRGPAGPLPGPSAPSAA